MKEAHFGFAAIQSTFGDLLGNRIRNQLALGSDVSTISEEALAKWIMTPWGYDAISSIIDHKEWIDLQGRPVETGSHDILEAVPAFKVMVQRPDGIAEKELCFNAGFKQQLRGQLNLTILSAMFAYDIVMFHHQDFVLNPDVVYNAVRNAFVKSSLPLDGPYLNFSMNTGALTGGFSNGLRFGKFSRAVLEGSTYSIREAAKGVIVLNGKPTGFLLEHRHLVNIEKYLPEAHLVAKSVQEHVTPEFAKWGIVVDEVYMGRDKLITHLKYMQDGLLEKYDLLKESSERLTRTTIATSPIETIEVVDERSITRAQTGTEEQ